MKPEMNEPVGAEIVSALWTLVDGVESIYSESFEWEPEKLDSITVWQLIREKQ